MEAFSDNIITIGDCLIFAVGVGIMVVVYYLIKD